jgi:DeoR family transcriptional regulator of aga operon
LLDILGKEDHLDVADAAARLEVSTATIRRDMDALAQQQLLTRTRGGAALSAVAYDLPLRYKASLRADEKRRIAVAAAALVAPGAVVGLNGGTTTTEVARELAVRAALTDPAAVTPELTVVTNAINIANDLTVRPRLKVVVTGGVVRPHSYELTGPLTAPVLQDIALDCAVLGVNAVHPDFGAAAHDEGEASANRLLAERAVTVIVVADSSKLGRRAFAQVCPIGSVSVLVTDTGAPAAVVERLTALGVQVLCV